MSTIQDDTPFEARLRDAFTRGELPGAPAGLRDALERIPDEPVEAAGARGARQRSTGRGFLGALGVAAVLLIGGAIALSGGGRTPAPPAPSAGPSQVPTVVVTYQLDWSAATPFTPASLARQVEVVRNRLAAFGILADVHADGNDRIVVTVPGGSTDDAWRRTVGQTGQIAFVPLGDQAAEKGDTVDFTKFPPLFRNEGVAGATVDNDQTGARIVTITLAGAAKEQFRQYTAAHIGSYLAITLDGRVLSAPVIQSEIPNGEVAISQGATTDGWDRAEATAFVSLVANGPLPVPMHEVSVESGPPGPPPGPIDSAAPTPEIAPSEPPASEPPASDPPEAVTPTCEEPLPAWVDALDCESAVAAAMAILPDPRPAIATVTFHYSCFDESHPQAEVDCLVERFGIVTIELVADPVPVVVGVRGSGATASAVIIPGLPISADAPTFPLERTPLDLGCDSIPAGYGSFVIHVDAAADVPVWAVTEAGRRLPVFWGAADRGLVGPPPVVIDGFGLFLAGDGTTIQVPVDAWPSLAGRFVCPSANAVYILDRPA